MMLKKTHITLCCALVVVLSIQMVVCSNIGGTRQDISLSSDGGYSNILIAIDESVEEDLELIDKLKNFFSLASEVLLVATNNQVYLKDLTILLPSSWKYDPSLQSPSTETVDGARVVVGPANLAWGDTPYTLQPGLCGQEGDYILLTSEYLKNEAGKSGAKPEKRLVKEFAHLKWGLFDEDVPVDYKYTAQFYHGVDGTLHSTRCVQDGIFGRSVDSESSDGKCRYYNEKQTYPPTCKFQPINECSTATASLMYAEYIDTVVSFCSDSGSTAHNRLAPNRQNKLCDQRSAWEVMLTLDDFAKDHKTNRTGVSPLPLTFTLMQKYQDVETGSTNTPSVDENIVSTISTSVAVNIRSSTVKCTQDVVCLALDASVSMLFRNRLEKMALAVRTYILQFLSQGTAVGMVSFNIEAKVLATMTELLSSSDQMDLLSAIPTQLSQSIGTAIGDGLEQCKDLLVGYSGVGVNHTRIVVITDGRQTERPAVLDVMPGIRNLGITLDTILYSQSADHVLINASRNTGGQWFVVSDGQAEEELTLHLQKTVERQCSTVAVISGEVVYTITIVKSVFQRTAEIVTLVTASPIPGVDPIRINTRVNIGDIQFKENTQLIIYVYVFQKYTPVLNLTVTVTIETSTGDQEALVCKDDGTGLDSTPDDGVYTAALNSHQFNGDGYYSIRVCNTAQWFMLMAKEYFQVNS